MAYSGLARSALIKVFGGVGTFFQKGSDPPEASNLVGEKILIMLRTFRHGGAEKQAAMFAEYLKKKEKMDVHVWAFEGHGPIETVLKNLDIPCAIHSPGFSKSRLKKIFALIGFVLKIRKLKPYILFPYTDFPNKVCCALWKFTGARACVWNQRDEGKEVTGRLLEKRAIKQATFFIANSAAGKGFLQEQFGVDSRRIEVIPNAVEIAELPPVSDEFREKLKVGGDDFVVAMAANLQRYKDHETLLEAWGILQKQSRGGTAAKLILAGRHDSTYEKLSEMSKRLGIISSVRFPGRIEDIGQLLALTDVGVLSSVSEGCPNVVLEYMAAGLPVVATDIAASRDLLGADYPYLAPQKDPRTLAEKILELFASPELRREIGSRNLERAGKLFTPEKIFARFAAVLKELNNKG